MESRGHFVISRLVVKHPFGWAVGGVLLGAECLHGGIPLGDGCDGGRNERDERDEREGGHKTRPGYVGSAPRMSLWP